MNKRIKAKQLNISATRSGRPRKSMKAGSFGLIEAIFGVTDLGGTEERYTVAIPEIRLVYNRSGCAETTPGADLLP